MKDMFEQHSIGLSAPAVDAAQVNPSNSQDLVHVTRAVYIGTGGDLAVELANGTRITLPNSVGGMMYPLRVRKVLSTGTTASSIVALW